MKTCDSCGGVIGRDCFNPSECAWIGQQQEMQAQRNAMEADILPDIMRRIAELEERVIALEGKEQTNDPQ